MADIKTERHEVHIFDGKLYVSCRRVVEGGVYQDCPAYEVEEDELTDKERALIEAATAAAILRSDARVIKDTQGGSEAEALDRLDCDAARPVLERKAKRKAEQAAAERAPLERDEEARREAEERDRIARAFAAKAAEATGK